MRHVIVSPAPGIDPRLLYAGPSHSLAAIDPTLLRAWRSMTLRNRLLLKALCLLYAAPSHLIRIIMFVCSTGKADDEGDEDDDDYDDDEDDDDDDDFPSTLTLLRACRSMTLRNRPKNTCLSGGSSPPIGKVLTVLVALKPPHLDTPTTPDQSCNQSG
jgi:hypothetical protein